MTDIERSIMELKLSMAERSAKQWQRMADWGAITVAAELAIILYLLLVGQ